jgi:uncharacterized membrane protein (DUF2068 family)
VAPAAYAESTEGADPRLAGTTADGRRLSRCLRCDVWLDTTDVVERRYPTVPSVAEVTMPRRGSELRSAIVLRLIAVNRAVHAVLFALVAAVAVILDLNLGPLKTFARNLESSVTAALANSGQQTGRTFTERTIHRVLNLHGSSLRLVIFTASAYCVLEGTEAVGLWLERRWAEYLTAVATAGFLPFEIHELITRVTAVRVGALVVNLAILVYLVWSKHLFGLRGGVRAEHTEAALAERLPNAGLPWLAPPPDAG